MLCVECGRRIGLIGRMRRSQFCCDEHRLRAVAWERATGPPATADDIPVIEPAAEPPKTAAPPRRRAGSSAAFAAIMGAALLVGMTDMPKPQALGNNLSSVLKNHAAVHLYDDFQQDFHAWTPSAKGTRAWISDKGLLQPGGLRLLRESLPLPDYRFEFSGQIQQKGFGWVFRARDSANYYAMRLHIAGPGPVPDVVLIRSIVRNGKAVETGRIRLPMTLRSDASYDVSMQIRGNDFTTWINGHIVDTWSDATWNSGGVGFFCEPGESALIRHTLVSENDHFTGRFFAWIMSQIRS
jgi:hypothetical protein